MFGPMYLALLVALFFYIVLPVSGGIITRTSWKSFRTRIMAARNFPRLGFQPCLEPEAEFRFFGEVDAIGGRNELWLRNKGLSCVVDARSASVYLLSGAGAGSAAGDGRTHESGETGDSGADGDSLEKVRWAALPSIPPVARAYVVGRAMLDGGRMVMAPAEGWPVLLIIHDGSDEVVEQRAIWSGRQKNEYWNPLTQVSLVAGLLAMSLIVSRVLSTGTLPSIAAITVVAGFSPLLPFLPPGVIGFILYRNAWRRARFCRSRRDLASFQGVDGHGLRKWSHKSIATTILSAVYLAVGLSVNFTLAVLVLRMIL
ncbi:MAG: hypothetical protein RBT68_13535 [Spirochaetia bacterium]|nr:hypothetical protein [Spirochaetia bacterium]